VEKTAVPSDCNCPSKPATPTEHSLLSMTAAITQTRSLANRKTFAGRPGVDPKASPSSKSRARNKDRTSFETVGGLMPVCCTKAMRESPPFAWSASIIRRSFTRRKRLGTAAERNCFETVGDGTWHGFSGLIIVPLYFGNRILPVFHLQNGTALWFNAILERTIFPQPSVSTTSPITRSLTNDRPQFFHCNDRRYPPISILSPSEGATSLGFGAATVADQR
jgi:hypothetical protein